MKITRRAALKSSALAATALALRGSHLFSQASAGVDAHIDILPGRADRHHLAGDLRPLHRAPRRSYLRRRVGWAGLQDPQHQRHSPGLHRHDEGGAGAVLRWPGGCFADSYDWRDGLGAADKRPARTGFWGQQDSKHLRPARVHAHLPRHRLQALSRGGHALAAGARLLPGDRVLQRARRPRAVELRRARRRPTRSPLSARRMAIPSRSTSTCGASATRAGAAAATSFRRSTLRCSAASPPGRPATQRTPLRFVAVGPNGDDVDWTRRLFKSLYANSERRHLFGLSGPLLHFGQSDGVCRGRCAEVQLRRLLRPADPRQHYGARGHRPLGGDAATRRSRASRR